MATSLVAAIESALDLDVALIEGHDGIYEVSVDNEVVYTNMSQCSQGFPSSEQIVERIGQFIGVKPKHLASPESQPTQEQGAACPLPSQSPGNTTTDKKPAFNLAFTQSDCGCGSLDSIPSSDAGCCDPGDDVSGKGKKDPSSGCR